MFAAHIHKGGGEVPYDWYSGSDREGRVPHALESYLEHSDQWSGTQRLEFLVGLLDIEEDPNWRAHLFYLIGAEYLIAGDCPNAISHFTRAEESFDPLATTFADVSSSYCRTRLGLIGEKLTDEQNDDQILVYALSVLCWKKDDTLSEYEFRLLLNLLGYSLARIAKSQATTLFDRMALQVRQRPIHMDIDRQDALENLFLSALALRDRSQCEKILERLRELGAPPAMMRELGTMMSNYLGHADAAN
jgi:hypothetical protein